MAGGCAGGKAWGAPNLPRGCSRIGQGRNWPAGRHSHHPGEDAGCAATTGDDWHCRATDLRRGCARAVPQCRPYRLEDIKHIRDLDPADIDKLVTIKGMVTRSSTVIPNLRCHAPRGGGGDSGGSASGGLRCMPCHAAAAQPGWTGGWVGGRKPREEATCRARRVPKARQLDVCDVCVCV